MRRHAGSGIRAAVLFGALAVACGARSVVAADPGSLEFRIVDARSGEPLAGAVVAVVRDASTSSPLAARSDARGVAAFAALPAGSFSAEVSYPGYARMRFESIRVGPGERSSYPVRMVASLSETIVVAEARATVDLEETSPSTRFTGEFLEDLPVQGRSFQNMLTLAPGVQDSDGDGNPNVHGSRERDFKVLLGDVSNQDPFSGLYLGYVNPDTIEELEVYTVGAGADFGRAQGGFAKVVQKQGSNDLEGVLSAIARTWRLDGNGASNTPADHVPEFSWWQPALQLSGPIVRDHLWYRLSHEYQSIDTPVNTLGRIAVTTHRQTIADDQLTWQITPRHKLALNFRHDPFTDDNVDVSSIIPPESAVRNEFRGTTWSATFTSTPTPRFLFDGTAAYQDYRVGTGPSRAGVRNTCAVGVEAVEIAQCLHAGTGQYSGSYNVDRVDDRQRFTFATKATAFLPNARGGSHQLRWGFGVENERFFRRTDNRPFLNFRVAEGGVDVGEGRPSQPIRIGLATLTFTLPRHSQQHGTSVSWGVWGEHQWKPRSGLVVTLGLRYDREEVSASGWEPFDPEAENRHWQEIRTGVPAIDSILLQNAFTAYEGLPNLIAELSDALGVVVSLTPTSLQGQFWSHTRRPGNLDLRDGGLGPRFAISWDPSGDGRTKIAFNAGRYYDKTFLAIPIVESDPATVSVLYTARPDDDGLWRIESGGGSVNPALLVRTVRHDLRIPFSDEYAVTLEREIAPETVVRLVGVRRRFEDQFQDIDRNRAPGDFGRCVKQTIPIQPYVASSPGSGFLIEDPYTGTAYQDTDPGPGDGRIDDCTGALEVTDFGGPFRSLAYLFRPDGVPDLYLQNPAWGSVLEVGNFNRARYSGVTLELIRRLHRNWQMEGSYTWSRARGDAEDFLQSLGNDRAILDDERGFLSYDQRHVVKVNATVVTPWNVRLGTAVTWQSGLPFSSIRTRESLSSIDPQLATFLPPDPLPRTLYEGGARNDRRNRSYWNVDVRAAREFSLGRGTNLRLTAEVFNLLNDGTYVVYNAPLKSGRRVDGHDEAFRRFGRQFQVGLRLAF